MILPFKQFLENEPLNCCLFQLSEQFKNKIQGFPWQSSGYEPNAGGEALIPGQGAKIPHDSRSETQKAKQKQFCNKFRKVLKK